MSPAAPAARALQDFAKTLADRPLDPCDAHDQSWYLKSLHIERDADGIQRDPIARLARKMGNTEGGGHLWLFTGNIGVGKSTELRRLKGLLENDGMIVLLADAQDYMHLHSSVEISDFLIAVSAAFAHEVGKLLGSNEAQESYWKRITHLLKDTQISVTETSIKAGLPELGEAEFKAALRLDPTYKQRLQQHMRAHLSTLEREVRALFEDLVGKLRAHFGSEKKIALLFDNMERLRGSGPASNEVFTSLRAMFTQFHDMLRLPGIQALYSVPPYLGRLEPQLYALFGEATFCYLTFAHVFHNAQGRRLIDDQGLKQLVELIRLRYPDWSSLLPEEELKRLIVYSGGDLRDLFRFIKDVLIELEEGVPPRNAVNYVLGQVRRTMSWVLEQDEQRLKAIAQSKQLQRGNQSEMDAFVRDMETKRVLMYLNGEEWYDLHPLLWKTLDPDNAPEGYAGD